MREGVHSGSLWAVASTPLFCSHFHKAWRGVWRSYIGVAYRSDGGLSVCFPYRGKMFSIAWKTGCRGSLSSSSGRRRGSTIHLSSCCEAERHGSADPTPCGGYAGPDCWDSSLSNINCKQADSTSSANVTHMPMGSVSSVSVANEDSTG